MPFDIIEKSAEKAVGLPIKEIRKFSPGKLRDYLEKKNKRKLSFTSEFPAIGRGSVLRDVIVTTEEINRDIDKILEHSN